MIVTDLAGQRLLHDRARVAEPVKPNRKYLTGELQEDACRVAWKLRYEGHTVPAVAAMLRCTERHVYRMCRKVSPMIRRSIKAEVGSAMRDRREALQAALLGE